MMKNPQSPEQQTGYFLVLATIFVLSIGAVGSFITHSFSNQSRLIPSELKGFTALYNAESAIEIGTHLLAGSNPSYHLACNNLTNTPFITNAALNGGTFTLTGTHTTAASQLNTAISTSSTQIPLANATSFAPSGIVLIDNEFIAYQGITGNSLQHAIRGLQSSQASGHTNHASVSQNQCLLRAIAGIPNLSTPQYRREIKRTVYLTAVEDGWLAGDERHNQLTLGRWNNPTQNTWNDQLQSHPHAIDFNYIFALSANEAWAVGRPANNNLGIFHWTGGTWALTQPASAINKTLQGIHCANNHDCWAVGQKDGNYPTIVHWDGATWQSVTPASQAKADLRSVYCLASNDCWAVGNKLGQTPLIERWNGVTWQRVFPNGTYNGTDLRSVFCSNSNDCWAVGQKNAHHPLILHWDGQSWSRVWPTTSINQNLRSVYCNAPNDCWTVGNNNQQHLFILHWDGVSWTHPLPYLNGNDNLIGVSCSNANHCWSTGQSATMVHWNGSAWATANTPAFLSNRRVKGISLVKSNASTATAATHTTQVFN